jgi:hypothetical protein
MERTSSHSISTGPLISGAVAALAASVAGPRGDAAGSACMQTPQKLNNTRRLR